MSPVADPSAHESMRALVRVQDEASRGRLRSLAEASALQRAVLIEDSAAFRIGTALIASCRSIRGFLRAPGALIAAWRHARRRKQPRPHAHADSPLEGMREFLRALPGRDITADYLATHRSSPDTLAGMRMAVVMDEFTRAAFGPECDVLDITPDGFEDELDKFEPHLLFIESAWRGIQGRWRGKIHPLSNELLHLVDCCRRRGIPTVFWNKEDPAHFEHFIDAAREFDHVFTTDGACIERYRSELGHNRVGLLSFACQPRVHNPLERFVRRTAACFAGSWYEQYPHRARDFRRLVEAIRPLMEIDIFDRNEGRGDAQFQFPPEYRAMIQGRLAYGEITRAYKGYKFAINVNTITNSPTMLARRVFELMASNTVVVSNSTPALESQLPGLVIHAAEPEAVTHMLQPLVDDEDRYRRHRLHALREVLLRHTSTHRLNELCAAVLGTKFVVPGAEVVCVSHAPDDDAVRCILAAYCKQSWRGCRLILIVPVEALARSATWDVPGDQAVILLSENEASTLQPARDWSRTWVALLDPRDHYGQHYLTDLALATTYSAAGPVGKPRCHIPDPHGRVVLQGEGAYVASSDLLARASMVPATCVETNLLAWVQLQLGDAPTRYAGTAVDEYNYCLGGASLGDRITLVDA